MSYATRGSLGIGSKADNPTEYMRLYQRLRRQDAAYRARERDEFMALWTGFWLAAVEHYSRGTNCCADCGATKHLVIDHINEDGRARRRPQREGGHGVSVAFVRWLSENGYPDGFQVLCNSHNLLKYHSNRNSQTLEGGRPAEPNPTRSQPAARAPSPAQGEGALAFDLKGGER